MTSHFVASVAAISLLGAGFAVAGETRSSAVLPALTSISATNGEGASGQKCSVVENRDGLPGKADVIRTVLGDGSCVCTVTTGPENNNGAAETIVRALRRDRECTNPAELGNLDNAPGGGDGGFGGVGFVAGGVALAGGLGVALGKKSP